MSLSLPGTRDVVTPAPDQVASMQVASMQVAGMRGSVAELLASLHAPHQAL